MNQSTSIKPPIPFRLRKVLGTPLRRRLRQQVERFETEIVPHCHRTQQQTLASLLRLNADTAFAKDHGLRARMTLGEFRKRIPVSDYELVRPYVDRVATGEHSALLGSDNRLMMFAVTSGTTADAKLIPITRQFVADYRRGWQTWGAIAFFKHAPLQQTSMLQMTSHHDRFRTAGGTPCGNISGLVTTMQSRIVRSLYCMPPDVMKIDDPDAKRAVIARVVMAQRWIGLMSTANPGTLLALLDEIEGNVEAICRDVHDGRLRVNGIPSDLHTALQRSLRANPERSRQLEAALNDRGELNVKECWPLISLVAVWTGGSAAAYLPEVRRRFADIPVRDHGLHASEGRMTIPVEDFTPAGLLDTQSHFFEFIPVDDADGNSPTVLEAHELETGGEYLILLTTSSGLYRYNIRDVVRCVGHQKGTPLLEFRHKGAHISSITGEKLTESQVVNAVRTVTDRLKQPISIFTLTPEWDSPPGYTLYLTDSEAVETARLAEELDRELQQTNIEYREKRETRRLRPMTIATIERQAWQRLASERLASRGGSVEQYKHPFLLPDPEFQQLFRSTIDFGTKP